jgi:phosphoglycerate dehydrogenase-like enzyme
MRVVAWSENLDHPDRVEKADLFRQADIVTVHYKLSARSTNIVGASGIALMKPGALLVNTSRGPRTILTPHIGYVTQAGYRLAYGDAVEAITAYARSAPLPRVL